jgi:phosphoribosylanthranilate isomerase
MFGSNKPRVKICCIASKEEAQTAIQFGASALGLDLCNGVRTNGQLDKMKLERFFTSIEGL